LGRVFHFWDLPVDLVRVLLEEGFHTRFFGVLVGRFGVGGVARLVGVSPFAVKDWILREVVDSGGVVKFRFIPVSALIKFSGVLGSVEFGLEEVERHVIALKSFAGSGVVRNGHFPIMEDAAVIRVLVHMLGDGSIYPVVGASRASNYNNQCDVLRKQFISCLNRVFGEFSNCIRDDVSSLRRKNVEFPKWVGYVFAHLYPDARFGQMAARLPSAIFSLSRELQVEAVRTFADDDGSPQELCVRFVCGSKGLLEDFRKLILQLMEGDETLTLDEKRELVKAVTEVKQQKNWYRLSLAVPCFRWFYETIGFTHPDKQRELKFRIDAIKHSSQLDTLTHDILIFSELLNGPKTVTEVAMNKVIREDYVHAAFRFHRRFGRIAVAGRKLYRKKHASIWTITENGRQWFRDLLRPYNPPSQSLIDKVVLVTPKLQQEIFQALSLKYGTLTSMARNIGVNYSTLQKYIKQRRIIIDGKILSKYLEATGVNPPEIAEQVLFIFSRSDYARYMRCDLAHKDYRASVGLGMA
jgi:hypothetical protein